MPRHSPFSQPGRPLKGLRRAPLVAIVALAMAAALSGCSVLFPFAALSGGEGGASSAPEEQLDWESCNEGLMQCATTDVPLDWDDPEGEQITLSLIKRVAEGDKLGTLFISPDGLGASGVDYYSVSHPGATGIAVKEHYDVVAWDPRGVGSSTAVECLDAAGMDDYLYGDASGGAKRGSDAWIAAETERQRTFGAACAEKSGDLLGHVDTASTVRDLEHLRELVGDEKLNFLGGLYGTGIGAKYADEYPDRVGRMVLDTGLDPSLTRDESDLAQAKGIEGLLREYVESCLESPECPLSGTPDEAMRQIRAVLDKLDAAPGRGSDGRPVTASTALTAIILTLNSRDTWLAPGYPFEGVSEGNYDNMLEFADYGNGRTNGEYASNATEAFTAISCLDMPADADPAHLREQATKMEAAAPTLGPYLAYGALTCASWPEPASGEPQAVSGAGAAPILVLSATESPLFPYAWSEALAGQLESGTLVSYEGAWDTVYGRSPCVNVVVDDYFMEGTVPSSDPRCSEAKDQQLRDEGYDGSSRWPLELN